MDEGTCTMLQNTAVEHSRLFLELYGNRPAKIKFHHVFHLAQDMLYIGHSISCFATERKNKDVIAVSNASSRGMEKAAVLNFLHRNLHHLSDGKWCTKSYLENHSTASDSSYSMSTQATLTMEMHANDFVVLRSRCIGRVNMFFQGNDGDMVVMIEIHDAIPGKPYHFSKHSTAAFVDAVEIVEAIYWYDKKDSLFAIIPDFL